MRSPYDRALALCPNDAAKLELARIGAELQLGADSQEWVVMVLYAEARRLFGPSAASGAEPQIAKLESITSRLEAASTAGSTPPPITSARPRSRSWTVVGLLAVLMLVGTTTWIGGATVAIAQTHFRSARVAAVITTPAGEAAWNLMTANGADLPRNLTRCTHLTIHGRGAQDCILWRSGPAPTPTSNPLWALQIALASLPAWPLSIASIVALSGSVALRLKHAAPRVRQM